MLAPRMAVEIRGWDKQTVFAHLQLAMADTTLHVVPLLRLIAEWADASEWILARPSCNISVTTSAVDRFSPLWDTSDGLAECWWGDVQRNDFRQFESMLALLGLHTEDPLTWRPWVVPLRSVPADMSCSLRSALAAMIAEKGSLVASHMLIAEADPSTNPHWNHVLRRPEYFEYRLDVEARPASKPKYHAYVKWITELRVVQRLHQIPDAHLRIVYWFI